MKYFKPFFVSLAVSLFFANIAHAGQINNRHNMLPNNIPESIQFSADQTDAEIFFQRTSLPAQFHCYFAPLNNQQYKGLSARITSDNAVIKDQLAGDTVLKGGGNDVEIFSVQSTYNNNNLGSIKISLEGEIKVPTVTIMCAMHK